MQITVLSCLLMILSFGLIIILTYSLNHPACIVYPRHPYASATILISTLPSPVFMDVNINEPIYGLFWWSSCYSLFWYVDQVDCELKCLLSKLCVKIFRVRAIYVMGCLINSSILEQSIGGMNVCACLRYTLRMYQSHS